MAGRRMFSRAITGSGAFLDLSAEAQALYFLLGMEADDDGFVEGRVVLRMTQREEEELRLLEQAGYVKVFGPQLITYIVDWTVNNQIRRDRYSQSRYAALLEEQPVQEPEVHPQPEEAEDTMEADPGEKMQAAPADGAAAAQEKAPRAAQGEAWGEVPGKAAKQEPESVRQSRRMPAPGQKSGKSRPPKEEGREGKGKTPDQPPRSAAAPAGGYYIDPRHLADRVPGGNSWHIGL